jgi:hypothetical protein
MPGVYPPGQVLMQREEGSGAAFVETSDPYTETHAVHDQKPKLSTFRNPCFQLAESDRKRVSI